MLKNQHIVTGRLLIVKWQDIFYNNKYVSNNSFSYCNPVIIIL